MQLAAHYNVCSHYRVKEHKGQSVREFTIGKLSKQTQVIVETIRYYEKIGLMPDPPRSSGGFRIYSDAHLQRLTFIRRSRELGFSQPEVRKLLTLVDEHNYTCDEVREMTAKQLRSVQSKIRDLQNLEQALRNMVSECQGGDIPECPIIDVLSVAPGADNDSGQYSD
jgi:MerR family mercuric resistance operon transcriptional regulator